MDKRPRSPYKRKWWLTDPNVRSLSDEARGVFNDIMHHIMVADQYGRVIFNGVPFNHILLSKMLNKDEEYMLSILDEIMSRNLIVLGVDDVLECPYMIHDYEVHNLRVKIGTMGGNPALKKESEPEVKKEEQEYILTKKNRKVQGVQLTAFLQFWDVFNYKHGRAEAADAWLDLEVNKELFDEIIKGAKREAERRPKLEEKGLTPIYPQGWLSARRWEQ